MKAAVIYQSKTGFTKKYAQWIAEELGADLFSRSEFAPETLADYDTVIYGGGLYVVGINGVDFIKQNLDKLKGKKVAVYACGCTPPREDDILAVRNSNFTQEHLEHLEFFYMRGGFDYKRLGLWDKILMTLLKLKIKIKKKEKRSPDEQGMLAIYSRPADYTRQKNIEELLRYIRS